MPEAFVVLADPRCDIAPACQAHVPTSLLAQAKPINKSLVFGAAIRDPDGLLPLLLRNLLDRSNSFVRMFLVVVVLMMNLLRLLPRPAIRIIVDLVVVITHQPI